QEVGFELRDRATALLRPHLDTGRSTFKDVTSSPVGDLVGALAAQEARRRPVPPMGEDDRLPWAATSDAEASVPPATPRRWAPLGEVVLLYASSLRKVGYLLIIAFV